MIDHEKSSLFEVCEIFLILNLFLDESKADFKLGDKLMINFVWEKLGNDGFDWRIDMDDWLWLTYFAEVECIVAKVKEMQELPLMIGLPVAVWRGRL